MTGESREENVEMGGENITPEADANPDITKQKQGSHTDVADNDHQDLRKKSLTTEEVAGNKKRRREQKPMWLPRIMAERPKLMFGLTLGGHIFMILISAILVQTGYDLFPLFFDKFPLEIRNDVDFLRGQAWGKRMEDESILTRRSADVSAVQDGRSIAAESLQVMYEYPGADKNVFTKANLLEMKKVEEALGSLEKFKTEFCLLDGVGNCAKAVSILRFFDGTYSGFNDPDFNNIPAILWKAYNDVNYKRAILQFIGKDGEITPTNAYTSITVAFFSTGMPLTGYSNVTHDENAQKEKISDFFYKDIRPLCEDYFKKGVGEMSFVYASSSLIGNIIQATVIQDNMLALGSVLFIFIFMCIQTGSVWVSGWAMMSIITGFVCTNLIYRCILDFRYLGPFHVLAIFIILGIGADDVFVFIDTWKETGHHSYPSLAHRLSDCYRRAAMAMMFTSLTTAVAFVVSAAAPFLGISAFGVFAAVLVMVNYISVIVFFPTVVITYHLYFEKYKCCCCCPRHAGSVQDLNQSQPATMYGGAPPAPAPATQTRKHPVVRFFKGPYFQFVTHKVFRWVILAVNLALIGFFIGFATQVQVNEEDVKFMKDSTVVGKFLDRTSNRFTSTSENVKLYIIWGLKPQDLSKCHKTSADCVGETVWDNSFDLNSIQAQQALEAFCNRLTSMSSADLDKYHIQRDVITQKPEVRCFLTDMGEFMKAESDRMTKQPPTMAMGRRYPPGTNLSLPLDKAKVDIIINNNAFIYDSSKLPADFSRYFDLGVSFWLYNGFLPGQANTQFKTYGQLLGEAKEPGSTVEKNMQLPGGQNFSYYYGNRLRYVAVVVNTTLSGRTLSFPKGMPVRDAWEDLIKQEMEQMPAGMKGGFQATPGRRNAWHWIKVQEALVSSAILGVCVGIGLAYPVLVFATLNIIVGTVALLSIICTTVTILGIIPLAGWKIGLSESLNLVMVVGLSVDYVVHLAEGYSRSEHLDRLGRTRDMLEEVGISVMSGAITSLGASFFLFFADIVFFSQFGIFIFCIILFSIFYSLTLFVTLMGLMGPQGTTGSLKPLFNWCRNRCCSCCGAGGKEEAGDVGTEKY